MAVLVLFATTAGAGVIATDAFLGRFGNRCGAATTLIGSVRYRCLIGGVVDGNRWDAYGERVEDYSYRAGYYQTSYGYYSR